MPTPDDTPETLVAAGRRFRATGDLDAAVQVFSRAHSLDPTSARPLVERGAILILQHRYDETLADYRRAEQLDPHYPGLQSYFAELYLYTGRAADALRVSTDAATGEPGNLMHRINIAHAQLLLGNTDAALNGYRDLADQWHPTKKRSGRELALHDLRLLDDAGITVPAIDQARAVLDPTTTDLRRSAVTSYRRMVALGSSFAAGPGIQPMADRKAARSARNYAHLVAEALGADLVDATVSGATTKTILDDPQRLGLGKFAPQIESLHPDADLVTVTAGGNDLGYIGGMLGRGVLNTLSQRRLIGHIARRFRSAHPLGEPPAERAEEATAGLVRIVEAVHRTAPAARCILVDYLPVFTEFTVPGDGVPFGTDEIAHFRRVADVLSGVYREAGERSGAEVLHSSEYDGGHGAGSIDPWVFGLRPIRLLGSSFHPTPAGMRAVADLLLGRLAAPPAAGG